jgi:hypothetical protein
MPEACAVGKKTGTDTEEVGLKPDLRQTKISRARFRQSKISRERFFDSHAIARIYVCVGI